MIILKYINEVFKKLLFLEIIRYYEIYNDDK